MSQATGMDNPAYKKSQSDLSSTPEDDFWQNTTTDADAEDPNAPKRDNWGNDLEFLMSCIALSVGLGNVWRFPFIALQNGGGAFLIPYLITLVLVGKPIYYLEMIMGQFSSRGSVKVYDYAPIMRGIGFGQFIAVFLIGTFYSSLMALTLRYLIDSFYAILPWSYCREEWGDMCIDSNYKAQSENQKLDEGIGLKKTSAEFYFVNIILREKDNIDDGIGVPNWTLVLTLAFSWLSIAAVVFKGIKSSGKASYFLAIFPYVVMLILLIRSLTLPGAFDGVLFFLKPQWDKLLDAKVWYAAVTQVFFSLSICYGSIVMYASYNRFQHNIRRDCNIVATLDTLTSLLSGIIIFGILGNLAYESNTNDIQSVVKEGPGLAFISYPDAIAKFNAVPQVFSVLFFLMLFILGVGTNAGVFSTVITVICDRFTTAKRWMVVLVTAVVCYCFGLMYVTPGGQFMLSYIDFYGVTFVAIVLAIFELISAAWIYGVKNICRDIKFMLNVNTSIYYRICWSIITPIFVTAILIYMLVEYEPLQYNGVPYPDELYVIGWCISAVGIGQLLIWGFYAWHNGPSELSFSERFRHAFKPLPDWGPRELKNLKRYQQFVADHQTLSGQKNGFWAKFYDNIFG
uniref:Transporter n=1 Tax=Stomoxys calcitrans TaxID=35570 RepID=A0A1I8PI57_STOCA